MTTRKKRDTETLLALSLFVYGPTTTGVSHFQGCAGVYRLGEIKTLLRGIYYGAKAVREAA